MKNSIFNAVCKTRYLALLVVLIFTCENVWGASPEVINIADYAAAHSWSDNTQYRTITSGPVTITAHDNSGSDNGSNTGKYIASGSTWRLYKTESSYLTISVESGYELESITFTFTASNNGAWTYNSSSISSGSAITVSGTSVSTGVVTGQTTGKKTKNGQIQITAISVAYSSGCTPPATALSITNASTATVGTPLSLTTSGGNGGTVIWSVVNGTGSATVSGSTLTPVSAGTVTVTATQGENTVSGTTYCGAAPTQEITISVPRYTVSFSTGTGNPTQADITEASAGAGITLPNGPTPACSSDGWVFAGWAESSCSETTTAPELLAAGDKITPESDMTLYAVYYKLTSGTSTATFAAADISNLTEHTVYPLDWRDNTGGVDLYIEDGQRYPGNASNPAAWNVTKSTASDDYFALIDAHRKISSISITVTDGTKYKFESVEQDAGTASLSTSSNTQTVTCSGNVTKVYLYSGTSYQVRATSIAVTYYNAKYNSNPTCSTDPELRVTPTALDFGNVANGTYKEMTFSLSGTHLAANASIAVSGTNSGYFTVTPNSVDKGSGTISATNITVRYTPGAVADGHTATVTVSSTGAEPQTVTLTGNCKASYSVTVTPPTNGTVTADKTTNVMAGETVTLTITPSSGYYLSAISANSGAVSLSGDGDTRTFTMPAGNVTITATFAERVDYVLVKDVNDLYEDASVVICNKGEVEQYARVVGAYADGNNWPAISASVFSDGGVLKILESTAYMQKFTLKAGTTDGTWAFYDGTGYIKAASSSNNYMKRESPKTDNSSFAITINTTTGLASVVSQGTNTHNAMDYNAGNTLFSCYTSATGVYIYIIPASCERLAAPTDLTASSITKTTCTLSWNSVTNASGYEISLDNGSSWTSTSTSTSYNATGLTAGTTYNWKVRATGDGDTYCAKGNAASSTVTMKNAVTVTYNDNGKTSGSVPATANLIEGDSYTVAGNTGTLVKDGYTWAGWHNSTTYNATPAYGTGGSTITVNSSIILYANWAPKRDTFIDGVHGNATQYGDGSYTVPSCSNATRHTTGTCEETHYKFIGWALSGADLTNQANIISAGGSKNATNATYYAVWAEEL